MKKLWTLLLTLVFVVGIVTTAAATTAYATDTVISVNGTEYTDHGTGWSAAVKLASGGTDVTVKLFADWIAEDGVGFICPEGGTLEGALYVGAGKLTLDLNGFKVDRNAPSDAQDKRTLYLEKCTFTINDSSKSQSGQITGGRHMNGAGIYAEKCTLTLNGGSITNNRGEDDGYNSIHGGGLYLKGCTFNMNGGSISENYIASFGGGFGGGMYLDETTFVMNDGVISDNKSSAGGGIAVTAGAVVTMNGGKICNNETGTGGGIYFYYGGHFIMNDGEICNNMANGCGGAIHIGNNGTSQSAYGKLTVLGGKICNNVAGYDGGGIYLDTRHVTNLINCTITGNTSLNGCGGGVAANHLTRAIYLGGSVNITGNTAFTTRVEKDSNLHLFKGFDHDDVVSLLNARGQQAKAFDAGSIVIFYKDIEIYDIPLTSDARIGLSAIPWYKYDPPTVLNDKYGMFSARDMGCFFSDEADYVIKSTANYNSYYDMIFSFEPSPDTEAYFSVTNSNGETIRFSDYENGWVYVKDQSQIGDVTVKLLRDWIAPYGAFDYEAYSVKGLRYDSGSGVKNGALHVSQDFKHNLTIDLNGYTISRNLEEAKLGGHVFYIDTPGSVTIMDSSEKKTGKITGANNTGDGGAFYVDYGKLYIKDVSVVDNKAKNGGAIYCDDLDDACVYLENAKINGNTATEYGGAIYVYNGYLDVSSSEIRDNNAKYGGGVYWNSDNACYLTNSKIAGNVATEHGGGVYVTTNGKVYIGGNLQITENYYGNLYLDGSSANIYNACGQDGAPNKPLTDGAKIGITSTKIEEEISTSDSKFDEGDFRYMYSDIDRYFIRSVYDEDNYDYTYKLYINTWGHTDARYPRVKSVSVKDSNLLADAVLDYDTQTITLVAYNTRRNFFERAALADLVECTYDKDIYYLYQMDYMRDLRDLQEYKIMSDNGTYVICKVNVVPEGGEWADVQESVDSPYKMVVKMGVSSKGFNDFDEGWTYAVSQSNPVTITLFADWNATDGEFDYSKGTSGGALYIDGKDITIDLNGNTINRGLTTADSDGHVFWLVGGAKLTINDTSDACSGKITGAYGSGNGGAFYVDYAKLYINGGEISGNQAKNGAAIYSTNEDDSFIYINGGKFTGNTATENGGAIFMEEGFLYMDGGEISGNTAVNGGGIYWNSENKLCLTGGKITGNGAKEGAGVYATHWGDIYVGGTIFIKDNIMTGTAAQNNFILSDTNVYLNNAAGQPEIPNKPLTDGACIGIHGAEADTLISSPDSRFDVDSAKYFKADRSMYWVYGWYDASGGDNTYKLYYNFDALGSELPRIKTIARKGDTIVQASVNSDSYAITLTADMKVKKLGTLENAKLSDLIDVTFSKSGVQIMNFDADCDYTEPQKVMVIDADNLYSVYTVTVEWVCSEHTDADNDGICDDCREYTFSNTTIVDYNAQTQEATVFVTKPGRYSLIFADYENGHLANVDVVERDFKEGINSIPQNVKSFTLESGDKVMFWYNMVDLVPVREALIVK